jgi:hypothetical protein
MAGATGSGDQWSSRWGFLLAAVGFAVGMGNIWRFPYVLGENGGSAFLFIYLAFALGIGLPLLITEITIGRRGKSSATGSYQAVATECGRSKAWRNVGTLGIFCAFVILSYYTVISGWTLDYFVKAASGTLEGVDADSSNALFAGLLNDPWKLLFWNTAVHLLIIFVIRRGVQEGIESAVKILMPALFISLLVMVIYGVVAGDMVGALKFLLEPDFSKVTFGTAMMAIGQAFFSIGIGMGSLVVFGAYMPKDFSIARSSTAVILLARDLSAGISVWSGCREWRRPDFPDAAAGIRSDARWADLRLDILHSADLGGAVILYRTCRRRGELGRRALGNIAQDGHPLCRRGRVVTRHPVHHFARRVVGFLSAGFRTVVRRHVDIQRARPSRGQQLAAPRWRVVGDLLRLAGAEDVKTRRDQRCGRILVCPVALLDPFRYSAGACDRTPGSFLSVLISR